MNNQWSANAQQATREAIEEQTFGIRDEKVYFKHIDGTFGLMAAADLIAGHYVVHDPMGEQIASFESIDALLNAGWILD